MDFHISPQQREMIQSVRDLAQREFKATAMKWMDGTFPWENMKKLAELGVLGMSVPEEYGGLGLPILDTALILEEIAKVDYVTAMAVLGEESKLAPPAQDKDVELGPLPSNASGLSLSGSTTGGPPILVLSWPETRRTASRISSASRRRRFWRQRNVLAASMAVLAGWGDESR